VLQWNVNAIAVLVVQHGVPVEEGATTAVLSRQAHGAAIVQERGVGQRFGAAPIERQLAGKHLRAVGDHLRHARMEREAVRKLQDTPPQQREFLWRQRGLDQPARIDTLVARPVDRVLIADHAQRWMHLVSPLIEGTAVLLGELFGIAGAQHAVGDQTVGIQFAQRRMLADGAVHERLRGRGLVRLVVAQAPVADQVDDDVLVKALAVTQRQTAHKNHGLGIIRVHMQDRRLNHT
jgi:hypothetical protein